MSLELCYHTSGNSVSKDLLSVVRPKEISFICTWSRVSAELPVVIQTNINQRYLRVLLANLKSPKRYLLWPEKRPDLSWCHHRPFSAKWRLRNNCRNSILMTCHYPDLGSPSDWLNQISHAARPIRSTTQIWVVTRHQYGISALVSQTSFGGETTSSPFISGICFLPLEPKKQKQITWSQVRETSRASPNVGFFLRPALVKLTAKKRWPLENFVLDHNL